MVVAKLTAMPPKMYLIGVDFREGGELPVSLGEIADKIGDAGKFELVNSMDDEEVVAGVSSKLKDTH
jgi:hypothetical protein